MWTREGDHCGHAWDKPLGPGPKCNHMASTGLTPHQAGRTAPPQRPSHRVCRCQWTAPSGCGKRDRRAGAYDKQAPQQPDQPTEKQAPRYLPFIHRPKHASHAAHAGWLVQASRSTHTERPVRLKKVRASVRLAISSGPSRLTCACKQAGRCAGTSHEHAMRPGSSRQGTGFSHMHTT